MVQILRLGGALGAKKRSITPSRWRLGQAYFPQSSLLKEAAEEDIRLYRRLSKVWDKKLLANYIEIGDSVFLLSFGSAYSKPSPHVFGSGAVSSSRDNCQPVRTVLSVSGGPMVKSDHRQPIKFYFQSLPETSPFDRYIGSEIPSPVYSHQLLPSRMPCSCSAFDARMKFESLAFVQEYM